ncbi:MAG: CRISPR-associated protein Cas2 [Fusobacteriaceae bacterium]|jgi:CRISPR-associated endonuclease Cas2|nr:cas2 [Fusobacteriales bacterium]MDN5304813.1 CRISPR-associated protein Cas2 [Fusobacteriaceae bacterium]
MKYIVAYDIVSNKKRRRVANLLKEYNLFRIQKSVFFGKLTKKQLIYLQFDIFRDFNLIDDSILIIPICKEDYDKTVIFGNSFDLKLTDKEIDFLYF